jgi:DNA-binding NarL/FixJ family response regulator
MKKPMDDIRVLLIVDDDRNFREGMKRVLHTFDKAYSIQQIIEADDGESAMAVLKSVKVGVVILDHFMPGGTGLHWLGLFLQAIPDLQVIMATGAGSESLAVDAMKGGAIDYLVKGSISKENLQKSLANAFHRKELVATIEQQKQTLMEAERHRVMIESLGAACHRLGQPVTALGMYLGMMKKRDQSAETARMLDECMKAYDAIAKVIHQLQKVSTYRTEPYVTGLESQGAERRILVIDPDEKH